MTKNNKISIALCNCTQTGAIVGFEDLGKGEVRIVDRGMNVLSNTTIVDAKEFAIVYGVGDHKYAITPFYPTADLKAVTSGKAQLLCEKRVTFAAPTVTRDYSITVDMPHNPHTIGEKIITLNESFEVGVTSLYDYSLSMVSQLVNRGRVAQEDNSVAGFLITAETGTAVAGATPTINKGDDIIPGITGAAVGDAVLIDGGAYTISKVYPNDDVALDFPYLGKRQTLAAINLVTKAALEADTTLGFAIQGASYVTRLNANIEFNADFELNQYGYKESQVTIRAMCYEHGSYNNVTNELSLFDPYFAGFKANCPTSRLISGYLNSVLDHFYSNVNLEIVGSLSTGDYNSENYNRWITVWLDRGSEALIAADDAATEFGTNIKTGTGLSTVASTAFLNVINALAVHRKILFAGANTTRGGGNEITAGTVFSTGIDV